MTVTLGTVRGQRPRVIGLAASFCERGRYPLKDSVRARRSSRLNLRAALTQGTFDCVSAVGSVCGKLRCALAASGAARGRIRGASVMELPTGFVVVPGNGTFEVSG